MGASVQERVQAPSSARLTMIGVSPTNVVLKSFGCGISASSAT
jgi:hypothetical protein